MTLLQILVASVDWANGYDTYVIARALGVREAVVLKHLEKIRDASKQVVLP